MKQKPYITGLIIITNDFGDVSFIYSRFEYIYRFIANDIQFIPTRNNTVVSNIEMCGDSNMFRLRL